MAATTEGHQIPGYRNASNPSRRRREGDRSSRYGADYAFPGMLFGRVLRSPHAHAIVKSIKIDKALKLPGVKAIVTGADLPRTARPNRAGRRASDQPASSVVQHPRPRQSAVRRPRNRAVAATSPHIAEEALRLIEVEYESAAAGDDGRGRDGAGRADPAAGAAQQGGRPRQADQRRGPCPVQAR